MSKIIKHSPKLNYIQKDDSDIGSNNTLNFEGNVNVTDENNKITINVTGVSTIKSNLIFRDDPTYNGEIYLLGWYVKTDTAISLTSTTPVTASEKGYHSHFVIDVSAPQSPPFTVRVTGTSVNESTGALTTSDTEDITVSAAGYYQTVKSWINDVQFSIVESGKSCTMDIYRTTYWDRGNKDFTIEGCRLEWTPDQNNWEIHIKLYHHHDDGTLTTIDDIHFASTDTIKRAAADKPGKYKRGDYNQTIAAADKEGIIVWIDQEGIGSFFFEVKYCE